MRLSHFFDVPSGTAFTTHHLSGHKSLTASMRLYLAVTYDVDDWVAIAFKELMKKSILDITENDEQLLGRFAYRLLIRTHAQVQQHRTNLAFRAPAVTHASHCSDAYQHRRCAQLWEEAWFGKKGTPGMVAALLDQCLPGAALYAVLDKFQVPGMYEACRMLTLTSLQDTAEKTSPMKKEDVLISAAIQKIKALM